NVNTIPIPAYDDHRTLHSLPTRRSSDLCDPRTFRLADTYQSGCFRNSAGHQPQKMREGNRSLVSPDVSRASYYVRAFSEAGGLLGRKSTRLKSSLVAISYVVFCLKIKRW